MRRVLLLSLILLGLGLSPALAVNPDERLADPALEARARTISAELRCMVCQNQSIDDSNADLARDLRLLVRKRLVQGDSDRAVIDYVVSRYGEFVLLRPRFETKTLLLWGAPLILAAGAATAVLLGLKRRQRRRPAALSAEEEAKLSALLSNDETKPSV